MAIETTLQKLERVQTAIKAIEEGAQEYSINGRRVTRGNLAELYRREKELLNLYYLEIYGNTAKAGLPGAEKL